MNRQIPMNRQIRLALSTTTLLIGVALLASCSPSLQTESPPPQEQSSQALREEMEEERKNGSWQNKSDWRAHMLCHGRHRPPLNR